MPGRKDMKCEVHKPKIIDQVKGVSLEKFRPYKMRIHKSQRPNLEHLYACGARRQHSPPRFLPFPHPELSLHL